MATEGSSIQAYGPGAGDLVLGEAAALFRTIGFAAQHAIVIGGLVPTLLVFDPPGPAHVGTTDLDVCLSLALVDGETGEYERIEHALKSAGYRSTDASFRWRQRDPPRLTVEFFCPAADGRPSGEMFRPRAADSPIAKHNMGGRLAAFALDAGAVIALDVQTVERDVTLPRDQGRVQQSFRVCGLLGFLVAKTAALVQRDKPKDAYDIVWLLQNWPGGPVAAARAVRDSPAFSRADAQEMLGTLFREFASTDRLGPRSYARFTQDAGDTADQRSRRSRHAVGAVAEFQEHLSAL